MSGLAKFIPLNPVEHENMLRTIIGAHRGSTSGNPTQWVVDAVAEAYQRGFGLGFRTGQMKMAPAPPPAFAVEMPQALPVAEVIDMPRIGRRKG